MWQFLRLIFHNRLTSHSKNNIDFWFEKVFGNLQVFSRHCISIFSWGWNDICRQLTLQTRIWKVAATFFPLFCSIFCSTFSRLFCWQLAVFEINCACPLKSGIFYCRVIRTHKRPWTFKAGVPNIFICRAIFIGQMIRRAIFMVKILWREKLKSENFDTEHYIISQICFSVKIKIKV